MKIQELSQSLAGRVHERLEQLVRAHLPGWRLPGVFAGHPVGPDVRADLAFVLGYLHDCGIDRVADRPVLEAVSAVLRPIDGPATHTFYSYRVAETLARFGPFDGNPVCEGWSAAERENIASACDSSSWAALVDGGQLPRNYAAVLARCEHAREALGLLPDPGLLRRMTAETASLLASHPEGYLDDSRSGIGRYDIYTADLYLFTEPMSGALGETWRRGATRALALVESVVDRRGHAITWGRSSGALASCLTIELAALCLTRDLDRSRTLWLALGLRALAHFDDWMSGGLISAHQHRSPYAYRGPRRRLQMTLDALGKLAWAARELREVALDVEPVAGPDADRDTWIPFESTPPAGVWSYRSRDLAFVLPVVGGTVSDYLPAPRNPGLFEVPVDSVLATGTPFAVRGGERFVAGHRPFECVPGDGALELVYRDWPAAGHLELDESTPRLRGERRVRFAVRGRRLHVHERWHFEELPDAVVLQMTETRGRPLSVECQGRGVHATAIDTDGLAEYRSFWSELPRVHQIDVEPAREIELHWSVAPLLRIASTETSHHYHRSLYDPLAGRVAEIPFARHRVAEPLRAAADLADIDIFHLHWPEWIAGPDADVHRRFVEALRRADVRIVWTQHNLVPHRKDEGYDAVYRVWAREADAAIHHSRWGMARVRERYAFGAHTIHRIIPHGHFGDLMAEVASIDRRAAEAELGLAPCALRIGVVGAPREEKRTTLLMEAFAAAAPADWQLLVLCLGPADRVPDDPRIRAIAYEHVPRDVYNRRLATIDLLAIPIEGGEYLTTGQFADAIGLGLPALTSSWRFLDEMLGEAAICYGSGREDLERCLASLDLARVARAREAVRELRERFDWGRIAELSLALFEEVGTAKL